MTWQEAGVIVIVGAAVAYLVRKFVAPSKPRATPVTFISVQQLKSRSRTKPDGS